MTTTPLTYDNHDGAESELADLTGATAAELSGLYQDSMVGEVARYAAMAAEDQLASAGALRPAERLSHTLPGPRSR
jgi:hypothetical protein